MSQQVTVKAYYNDLNESAPEIRRFPIEVTSDNDVYRQLETHVAQLNSAYVQGEFTLLYTDEDNDRITFSSNAELRTALATVVNGGTLKVYVKPKVKKVEGQQKSEPQVHPYVMCDGCQGPVVGIRYKCMECPDYDLCEKCSEKKIHSDHNMIKLTRPGFGGRGRCGRGPFGRGPCGGGLGRFWRHHQRAHHGQPEAHFQMPSNVTDFLSQFKGKELAELIEAQLPQWLRTEKIQELISQLKTGEQADKPVDQANILEHVGKFLREVLSPFGIDCDYWVDNKPKKESETVAASASPSAEPTKEEASASKSTEPKPSASASTSASAMPPVGNLFEQLQSMLGPILAQGYPQKGAAATTTPAEDEVAREKKKIDECLDRMTAMGFVDTNGVLTELIRSKKGDMNQVLDALNPRNYKS